MEEIFEVNSNKDIEDMDICDFTQETSQTTGPLKKLPVTFTILTILPEVHSYTPPKAIPKRRI